MKKKVGELYDKPIVIGNPNEFTKNEIALSELGGSNGGSNNIKYYNLPNDAGIKQMMPAYSTLVKLGSGDQKAIYSVGQILGMAMGEDASISESAEMFIACAVDFDGVVCLTNEGVTKISDFFTPEGAANANLVEITKEEFYNLNA